MPKPPPTGAELAILRVLWKRGASTVREVQKGLDRRDIGYTTVLKILQIMVEKGLVVRDVSERAHVYAASAPRERIENQLVGDLLDRAFGGSAERLVLSALSSKPASSQEIDRIRKLLDEIEGGRR